MMLDGNQPFFGAIKGKVILGFLFACFALLLAWGVSKFVFSEILSTVDKLSAPNDRLRMVNAISHQVNRLDQLQREQAFSEGKSASKAYSVAVKQLASRIDTLSRLYTTDKAQLKRLQQLKRLLADRNQQFLMYVDVRANLVNTDSFSEEVKRLNELLSQKNQPADTNHFTTEIATAITTIAAEEDKKSRGFLSRLFGKKKAEVYKIINEEYKVKRDTLTPQVQDSLTQQVELALQTIEREQKEKSERFIKKETELANSASALTRQMLTVIKEVESEALAQIDLKSTEARDTVNEGVFQIKTIILISFLITLVLGYLILTDITKSSRYRWALEQAKREADYHGQAKQRFLSNMSHEIRTPLQSILGYAELIAHQENPDKRHVKAIAQSSTHLLQIVNEILDYHRIISGELLFEQRDFEMGQVLQELTAAMHPLADQKKIGFRTQFEGPVSQWVKGDPFRLKQLLFNLLGNAIKFTWRGEVTLEVSAKEQDEAVHYQFKVTDTGVGIPEDQQERVFNEFEQIDPSRTHTGSQHGTGLGLAIVKTLVESMSGRMSLKSETGKGTVFLVHLSYQRGNQPVLDKDPVIRSTANTKKVWIIDDDRLILELCSLIFEQHAIPYRAFNSVPDILSAQEEDDLAYVLIDMRLPEMSGIALHHLLKERLTNNIRYYAITAQVLPDEQASVLAEGFEGIVMKPFTAADLLAVLGFGESPASADWGVLDQMTMGDHALKKRILQGFVEEGTKDLQELGQALKKKDEAFVHLLVHRLAGRLAQVGMKKLAHSFRELDIRWAAKDPFSAGESAHLRELMRTFEGLLEETRKSDYSIP